MSAFQPSSYQQAVYAAVEAGTPAIVVSAVAGSGKSTTLVRLLEHIPAHKSVMYLTFGKDANLALNRKIDEHVLEMLQSGNWTNFPNAACKTVHSLGNQALYSAGIKGDATKGGNKYMKMGRDLIDAEKMRIQSELRGLDIWEDEERIAAIETAAAKYNYQLAQNLRKLVDMTRLTLSVPTAPELRGLISRFEIDILPEDEDIWPFILKAVPAMLSLGIEKARSAKEIDFTDMIWLPSSQALNLFPQQFDVVLVDEAQDLSPCQRELALRACKPGGQRIFVGDRNQSIYGFAGASLRSIDEIIEATGAVELPLSICYRCPKSVIEEARRVGPEYGQIEAAPWASEGVREYTTPDTISSMVQPGDLILCRLTAPLVSKCLELLRDGKRANVRGRDLGAQFMAMIEQIQKFSGNVSEDELFGRLVDATRSYERRQIEIMSLNLDDNEMKIATLEDKVETLLALYEAYFEHGRALSLKGFRSYISDFFKEDPGAQIILSTGHRAKGLEYPRVFILDYDKLPHPRAKTPEAIKQEHNLQYVMVTRAQEALFLVVSHVKAEIQPELFDAPLFAPLPLDEPEEAPSLAATVNSKGTIALGGRVICTRPANKWHAEDIVQHGVVMRIDIEGVASKEDCYLVQLDGQSLFDYFVGEEVQPESQPAKPLEAPVHDMLANLEVEPVSAQQAETPRKRKLPQGEPTKKKDFRIPVSLLHALKAVAAEDGMTDTELVMSLIKSDARIQRKLFEDSHETEEAMS